MRVCIPELDHPTIQGAIAQFPEIDFLPAPSPGAACDLVKSGLTDSVLSGLDYSSRDVLLAYRDHLQLKSPFFSSCFICENPKTSVHFALADGGVNKLPTKEQFLTIIEDTARTFETYYGEQPRIALLSYSTHGSGGKNPDYTKFNFALEQIKKLHPDWIIDGELQFDAALSPEIAAKKAPDSPLKGNANILIVPDLNTGNILYKALEKFGGFVCAGPIIQGFEVPLADLSRGSTLPDVVLTLKVLQKLLESRENHNLPPQNHEHHLPPLSGEHHLPPANSDYILKDKHS